MPQYILRITKSLFNEVSVEELETLNFIELRNLVTKFERSCRMKGFLGFLSSDLRILLMFSCEVLTLRLLFLRIMSLNKNLSRLCRRV